jgi:hypothetical protein
MLHRAQFRREHGVPLAKLRQFRSGRTIVCLGLGRILRVRARR